MASELKPCICGKTPRLNRKKGSAGITKTPFYREQIVCRCGVSSKIFKAPNKAVEAWNTRPAPAATDTGLVTVGNITEACLLELKQMLCGEIHPCNDIGDVTDADIELVTRSQAEELLAAERAEKARLKSENDAQADQISELQMTPWPEWATKVLAVIRKRSGYDGYGDAIEGVDLPAELDECIAAIEADNAALTARVKELEADYEHLEHQALKDRKLRNEAQCDADLWRFSVDMGDHPSLLVKVWKQRKSLEAKLTAAEKALTEIANSDDVDNALDPARNKRAARAVLGGKPS